MMELTLPKSVIIEEELVDELLDGPCPCCDTAGMMEEVVRYPFECSNEDETKTEIIFISGIHCSNCEEIYFDDISAELCLNTNLRLEGEIKTKIAITEYGPTKLSVH